jgi:hypothetical protein
VKLPLARALVLAAVIALVIVWALLAVAGAKGAVAPASDVHRYGSPFCAANAWDWTETVPRMTVHAGGSCVNVPDEAKAAFTVTSPEPGTFPNIASGYELGLDSCPSASDLRGGLCDRYPVTLGKEGEPYATVKARLAPGYRGNVAFDDWYSPAASRTAYSGRCSANLGTAYTEVMVWLAHPGDYPGSPGDYSARLDGRRWRVMTWETTTGCPPGQGWRLVIFEAPKITAGLVNVHHLKLNVFSGYAIRQGWMGGSQYLTAIDLGFEIHAGGAGNAIDNYSLTGGAR